MTNQRGDITRRTPIAILATVILAALLTYTSPAHANVFNPNCTVGSLTLALTTANTNGVNDVIRLPSCANPYVITATLPVSQDLDSAGIPHKLVIRGRGEIATITQSSSVRLFNVQAGANVLFKNVTLANGKGTPAGGGAIYIAPGGAVRLEDSRIVDSSSGAGTRGGGIYNDSGTLAVVDSTFVDNSSILGGGAIANVGRLTVTGARFFRNRGQSGGAIVNAPTGSAIVVDSVFAGNEAEFPGGGAIRNHSPSFTVSGSTFSSNTASFGGAVLNSSGLLSLSDSTVSGNGGPNTSGGGVANGFPSNRQATVVIDRSTVSDNDGDVGGGIYTEGRLSFSNSAASGNRGADGGAFYTDNNGWLSVTDSVVSGNSAPGVGGGIRTDGTLDVIDSTILGNSSGNRGGGIFSVGKTSIVGSRLSDNAAGTSDGGAIYHGLGVLHIDDSRLTDNDAAQGGAVFADSGTATVADTVISNNHTRDRGAGIMTQSNARFTLEASTVSANLSDGLGGGIYNNGGISQSSTGRMSVLNSTISENSTPGNGGGFYTQGRLELVDSTIADNVADGSGGGIANHNAQGAASLSLLRTKILRNRASTHPASSGGAISSTGGRVSLTDSTIMENASGGGGGGGISAFEFGIGGGFSGSLTVNRSTIANNSTTGHGGGVAGFSRLSMTNVTVTGNQAAQGGGIYFGGLTASILHATIANNVAPSAPSIFFAGGSGSGGGGTFFSLINSIVFGAAATQCVVSFPPIQGVSNVSTPGAAAACGASTASAVLPVLPLADNGGPTPTMAIGVFGGLPDDVQDRADAFNCPATDQRGFPRPKDGPGDSDLVAQCDRGAFEWQ